MQTQLQRLCPNLLRRSNRLFSTSITTNVNDRFRPHCITSVVKFVERVNSTTSVFYNIPEDTHFVCNYMDLAEEQVLWLLRRNRRDSRSKPHIEVHGDVRTGKTTTASFVIPYLLHGVLKEVYGEEWNVLPAYISSETVDEMVPFVQHLYRTIRLQPDAHLFFTHPVSDVQYVELADGLKRYEAHLRKHHTRLCVVIDEVQLMSAKNLRLVKYPIKSNTFANSIFVLTGSTPALMMQLINNIPRNGVSVSSDYAYRLNIPLMSEQQAVTDTIDFLRKYERIEVQPADLTRIKQQLQEIFGYVNCSSLGTLIGYVKDGRSVEKAIAMHLDTVWEIYDRDYRRVMLNANVSGSETVAFLADPNTLRNDAVNLVQGIEPFSNRMATEYLINSKVLRTYLSWMIVEIDGEWHIRKQWQQSSTTPMLIMWLFRVEPLRVVGERIASYLREQKQPNQPSPNATSWHQITQIMQWLASNNNVSISNVQQLMQQ